jgi:peroxiredoxin
LSKQELQELQIGTHAPEFKLAASTGEEISLSDYKGKSHLVLFFIREYE